MIECQTVGLVKNGRDMLWWRSSAAAVLKLLFQIQLSHHSDRFLYYVAGARDEDGPAACLEILRFGDDGEVAGETFFTGFGEEASLLAAFEKWFVGAASGTHLRIAMMLSAGITRDEDIRAGLRLRSLDGLASAISAARKHGLDLHLFVHPKDERETS